MRDTVQDIHWKYFINGLIGLLKVRGPDLMFYKVSARVATKAGGHAKGLDLDNLL